MIKYLWHSSSIYILSETGLLNSISQIDGDHYVTQITKINTNEVNTSYFRIYPVNYTDIINSITEMQILNFHKEGISNEDILLYCLLKSREDLSVIVAGSRIMSKFHDLLHSRRCKLFSILSSIDYFKQYEIAKLLDNALSIVKYKNINVDLLNDEGFKIIHNIALGQQQG